MALNPNAIITVQQAKDYLKVDYTEEDSLIESLINQASDYLEKFKHKRKIKKTTITNELYNGNNRKRLFLKNYPISNVTVTKDGQPFTDFKANLQTGILFCTNGVWNPDFQNISVSYDAGYDPIPDSFVRECLNLVSEWYENRGGMLQ
jgi:hypothetical protein